ncbi:hypothetical protein WAI453_008046 [Rhynchosporium graminicola]
MTDSRQHRDQTHGSPYLHFKVVSRKRLHTILYRNRYLIQVLPIPKFHARTFVSIFIIPWVGSPPPTQPPQLPPQPTQTPTRASQAIYPDTTPPSA